MIQAKFSLKESHIQLIEQCQSFGFKNKSDVVRTALDRLFTELARERLRESAALYAKDQRQTPDSRSRNGNGAGVGVDSSRTRMRGVGDGELHRVEQVLGQVSDQTPR